MKKKNEIFSSILGLLILGSVFYFSKLSKDKLNNERNREDLTYVQIEKSMQEYKGKVISKEASNGYTGTTLIKLSNNEKFSISETTRNYTFCDCDFAYFLHIGDSIYKPANTDSIYIYRDQKEFFFRLGQILNYN